MDIRVTIQFIIKDAFEDSFDRINAQELAEEILKEDGICSHIDNDNYEIINIETKENNSFIRTLKRRKK